MKTIYTVLIGVFALVPSAFATDSLVPLLPGSSYQLQTATGTTTVSCGAVAPRPPATVCNIVRRADMFGQETFDVFSITPTSAGNSATLLNTNNQFSTTSFGSAAATMKKAQSDGLCTGGLGYQCTIERSMTFPLGDTWTVVALADRGKDGVQRIEKFKTGDHDAALKSFKTLRDLGTCYDPDRPSLSPLVTPGVVPVVAVAVPVLTIVPAQ